MLVVFGRLGGGPLTAIHQLLQLFNVKLIYIYIGEDTNDLTIVVDGSLLFVNLGYLRPLLQSYLLPTAWELVV